MASTRSPSDLLPQQTDCVLSHGLCTFVELTTAYWSVDAFKIGLCHCPPLGQPYSVLTLSNNTCIRETFQNVLSRYQKLFKRRAHVHHYQSYGLGADELAHAAGSLSDLIGEYRRIENAEPPAFVPKVLHVRHHI